MLAEILLRKDLIISVLKTLPGKLFHMLTIQLKMKCFSTRFCIKKHFIFILLLLQLLLCLLVLTFNKIFFTISDKIYEVTMSIKKNDKLTKLY